MGMGRVWESNSNLGRRPFLENVFLNSWASKCLEMHAQAIIHPYVLLFHVVGAPGLFPSRFCGCFLIPQGENPFLVLFSEWAEEIHVLGIFRGCVFLPHVAGVCCALPFMFSAVSPFFCMAGKLFLCC